MDRHTGCTCPEDEQEERLFGVEALRATQGPRAWSTRLWRSSAERLFGPPATGYFPCVTITEGPSSAEGDLGTNAELLALNREAVRTLHLLARELDDALHVKCVHRPLSRARDDLLSLAVRLQIALRDLD